ncbi:YjgN family protein [Sediminibacterium sp. C3]|uniref:YjgN family protein n=1 Tax=Sediminibacterium sp. C3 TaxID=1267211 RepID=UPI00040048BC|nr:DUF898 family protein [Sediminibacterium sp. C3]
MEYNKYSLSFKGSGASYFKILLVNIILVTITLGLYYPWARARSLQYFYSNTLFNGQAFVFTGTGSEMFKGFIKAFILLIGIYGLVTYLVLNEQELVGLALFYIFFLLLLPLAIHGSYRYRFAKTAWSGIRFGYTGDKWELFALFIKGTLLTLITFGIYGAWFMMNLRRYLLCNVKIGDARFSYKGVGGEYFWLNLKGYFLSIFTLGLYFFWWQKDLYAYFINNLRLTRGEQTMLLRSTATGGDFLALILVNLLLFVFTLGLATPWIAVRTMRFLFSNMVLDGTIAFDELQQTQPNYDDATGEDIADFLDFGFII